MPPRSRGTGRGGGGRAAPKPSATTIAKEQADCLRLSLDGLVVREIADELGIPKSTVQDRLTAAMAELVLPAADEVRLKELARLDRWQRRLEQRLTDDEDPVRVVPVALKVQERRAKLLGLDAPDVTVDATAAVVSNDPQTLDILARAREATASRIATLRATESP